LSWLGEFEGEERPLMLQLAVERHTKISEDPYF